jgi:hypothetical protein
LIDVIEEQWHLLDPAQIVNFGRTEHSNHDAELHKLLERDIVGKGESRAGG